MNEDEEEEEDNEDVRPQHRQAGASPGALRRRDRHSEVQFDLGAADRQAGRGGVNLLGVVVLRLAGADYKQERAGRWLH